MKTIYQSKTMWLNAVTLGVLVLTALAGRPDLLPGAAMPYIGMAVAIGNLILRTFYTNQGVEH